MTRIHDNTERPVTIFMDGYKNEFLLENINTFICSPGFNRFFTIILQCGHEVSGEEMHT